MRIAETSGTTIEGAQWRLQAQQLFFIATLAAALTAAMWFIYLSFPMGAWWASDFKVFWTAAQLEQRLVYDFAAVTAALPGETSLRPYLSPPTMLLAMQPLAQLPLVPAYLVWTIVGAALFCLATWRATGTVSLLVLAAAPAFHWAVIAGQVTLLVGGLIYAGALCLPRRPILAGLLFAAAALLKPQAALLVPVALIAGGYYRALAAAILGGGLAGLASLALQGANLWFEWFRAISAFAELIRANGFIGKGITPSALAYGLQAQDLAETAIVAGGAMLGLTCCWYVFTRTKDPALRGGALVCSSLLCTPYALTYEAASLLPAAAALLTGRHTGVATLMTAALVVCFPFSPLTVMFFAIGMIAHLSRKLPEEPAVELQLA